MELVLLIVVSIVLLLLAKPFVVYFRLRKDEVEISLKAVYFMYLRKTLKSNLVESMIAVKKYNLSIDTMRLETLVLTGGDPLLLVQIIIEEKEKGFEFLFDDLMTCELTGKNIQDCIALSKKSFPVEVKREPIFDMNNRRYFLNYSGTVKMSFKYASFGEMDNSNEESIIKTARSILETWSSDDVDKLQVILNQRVFDSFQSSNEIMTRTIDKLELLME